MEEESRTSSDSISAPKAHSNSKTSMFGLPPPLIAKQLISLSGDRKLLIHSHLLEFSGSLSVVASLPLAMEWMLAQVVRAVFAGQLGTVICKLLVSSRTLKCLI